MFTPDFWFFSAHVLLFGGPLACWIYFLFKTPPVYIEEGRLVSFSDITSTNAQVRIPTFREVVLESKDNKHKHYYTWLISDYLYGMPNAVSRGAEGIWFLSFVKTKKDMFIRARVFAFFDGQQLFYSPFSVDQLSPYGLVGLSLVAASVPLLLIISFCAATIIGILYFSFSAFFIALFGLFFGLSITSLLSTLFSRKFRNDRLKKALAQSMTARLPGILQ